MYRIFRERELISSNHISIFRIYPYIKDNYNITIYYKVKNPGRGASGEKRPGYKHIGIKDDMRLSRVTAPYVTGGSRLLFPHPKVHRVLSFGRINGSFPVRLPHGPSGLQTVSLQHPLRQQ